MYTITVKKSDLEIIQDVLTRTLAKINLAQRYPNEYRYAQSAYRDVASIQKTIGYLLNTKA